jgi:hypothetical protein
MSIFISQSVALFSPLLIMFLIRPIYLFMYFLCNYLFIQADLFILTGYKISNLPFNAETRPNNI